LGVAMRSSVRPYPTSALDTALVQKEAAQHPE